MSYFTIKRYFPGIKTPQCSQCLTVPLNHLQSVTEPEHKSWALTNFIHFPFCRNEKKQSIREEKPINTTTHSDFVTVGSYKAVCVTQSLSVINNRSGFSYAYLHKQPTSKSYTMVNN